ncbi:hypothetical protein [Tamilnaduibacter salinus]|uniref:hypothetical protein n=1 Tax=Tamilnaduibacter salinus TaxID=1484056 RepID=UPI00105771A3|nr:hypothetical protein [Tamilnaduibacter salinus]
MNPLPCSSVFSVANLLVLEAVSLATEVHGKTEKKQSKNGLSLFSPLILFIFFLLPRPKGAFRAFRGKKAFFLKAQKERAVPEGGW